MQKQLTAQNQTVLYSLKVSRRARRLRISVACDSSVVLTVPQGLNLGVAERFFESKLSWVLKTLEYFKPYKNRPVIKFGRREYLQYRERALALAAAKVRQYNQVYNFNYQKIGVKNQKTRWGSCSKQGNLNFNYKIVFLPERLCDYLVVHELCHLAQFNHSRKFWNLVAEVIPDYLDRRKELRKNKVDFFKNDWASQRTEEICPAG